MRALFWMSISCIALAASIISTAGFGVPQNQRIWAESDDLLAFHSRDPELLIPNEEPPPTYLEVRDKASGKLLWKTPCRYFRDLWISEDSQFIVGMALHDRGDPHHLVIFDRSGKRVVRKTAPTDLPQLPWSKSVSSNVNWYDHRDPGQAIVRNDKTYFEFNSAYGPPDAARISRQRVRVEIPTQKAQP